MNRILLIGLVSLTGCEPDHIALRDMGSFHPMKAPVSALSF
jgi:hypothetical protein